MVEELKAAWAGLDEHEQASRFAEIQQRLDAAAKGELFEEDDAEDTPLKPVLRDPELWEIRWTLGDQQWRLYHAEPAPAPAYLVALRFHRKCLDGDNDTIRAAQNQHIDVASRRYVAGRATYWGLP